MPSFLVTLLLFYIKWGVEFLLCINQQIIREHVIFFSVVSTCHVFIHIIKVYLLVFQFPSFLQWVSPGYNIFSNNDFR